MKDRREYILYRGGSGEIVEKKSRFIAHIEKVKTVEDAEHFIEQMKKKYWDARHNCYAFIVGDKMPKSRCSDDGEPSGTAGKPMLEILSAKNLHNIVVVVTRYFGGTLLGTGGLVRAYQEATKEGLKNCVVLERRSGNFLKVKIEYTELGKLQYILAEEEIPVTKTDYEEKVTLSMIVPEEKEKKIKEKLIEITKNTAQIEEEQEVCFGLDEGEVILL